jgi:hypothetical protein
MKISKQSILICLSVALMLAFSLVSISVAGELSDDTVRVPTEKVNAFWDDQEWDQLTKAEQDLWIFVGYTEAVWNGDAKNPPEEDKYWMQLTSKKREALEKMGYTKNFWDRGDPK